MKKRIIWNSWVTILMMISTFSATITQAQTPIQQKDHLGFIAAFGGNSTTITSNMVAINKMKLGTSGGTVGIVWGKSTWEAQLSGSYYFANAKTAQSADRYAVAATWRFLPLAAYTGKSHRVEPYFVSGFTISKYKLYGFYALDETQPVNYSNTQEPYVGQMVNYNVSFGSGLQVSLLNDYDFVKLFAEANYNYIVGTKNSEILSGTSLSNALHVNVGIAFGMNYVKQK